MRKRAFKQVEPARFLFLFSVVVLLGIPGLLQAQEKNRPNIIFMYSDDHTAQAIGDYQGNLDYGLRLDHSPTPHIDQLADQGMRFDNAFVTNSICKPSRAVLLTGLHSHLNGVPTNRQSIFRHVPTFPAALQDAGYRTAIFGKWHLGIAPQGFDHYEVLRGQGPYYNPTLRRPGDNRSCTGHTSDVITDRTLNWLKKQRDSEKPFMLMMNHKAPHRNWVPAADKLDVYDDRSLPEPDSLFYDLAGLSGAARRNRLKIAEFMQWGWDFKVRNAPGNQKAGGWNRLLNANNLTEKQKQRLLDGYADENQRLRDRYGEMSEKELVRWKYQRYVKDYLRVVRGIDDSVGRLMEFLDQSGLAENTVVVYSADQGFFLGENGWFDKRWIYEESLRLPLIVRWPGRVEANSVDEHLVQNLDFAPTLLDLAGVEVPDRMQGRSLVPLLNGNDPENWRDAIYYHYYEDNYGIPRHYGVRTRRYTLAHYYTLDEWELFDLKKDPDQLNSVYGEPAYTGARKRLKQTLNRLQEKYGDGNPGESTNDIVVRAKKNFGQGTMAKDVQLRKVLHLENGHESPPQNLDPSRKPISVGAWIRSSSPDGTIISRGGASFGYTLFLRNRKPVFGVRSFRELRTVEADQKIDLNTPVHLAGVLDGDERLHIYLNGKKVASGSGHAIATNPNDDLDVGTDGGSRVGPQSGPLPFQGKLRDVRVYWGVLPPDRIGQWASEPPF